jgi:hypothetical protein
MADGGEKRVIPSREPAQRADEEPPRPASWQAVPASISIQAGWQDYATQKAQSAQSPQNTATAFFSSAAFCAVRALCVPQFRVAARQPGPMTSQQVPRRCRCSG